MTTKAAPPVRRGGSMRRHQTRTAYIFLLVPLVFFLIVRFLPTFTALRLSLFDWNILKDVQPFVGTENYQRLVADEKFIQALKNTALYTVIGVPAQIALGLAVALMLNKIRALKGLFRALYFAPYVTPIVAAAWVWQWLFSPQFGPVNTFLIWLHITPQNFLNSPTQSLATTAALVVWQNLGFQIVLFLAGLAAIPRSYYEAAEIDGANGSQSFWKITFPLLNPTMVFSV
ncbi:carbohydrate ABC transporter permease, partial [Deinococcus arenicola]